MYFSVNLDQFQAVEGLLQTNGGFVQQLKGLKMKRIVASLISGVLAVSAFAATPRTAPVGKAVETQNASHSSSKHVKKVSHKVDHGNKHQKSIPTAKSLAVIK
jgi:hypothetical protein